MKRVKVNLFEILGEKKEKGLVDFLKSQNNDELKVIAKDLMYSSEMPTNKDNENLILAILKVMEKTLNIGYVFSEKRNKWELLKHYN